MRKAVAAIRWCNTLFAVPLAIQKLQVKSIIQHIVAFSAFCLDKRVDACRPKTRASGFFAEFEKRIHGWHYRTMVKPGLSGLAQVRG